MFVIGDLPPQGVVTDLRVRVRSGLPLRGQPHLDRAAALAGRKKTLQRGELLVRERLSVYEPVQYVECIFHLCMHFTYINTEYPGVFRDRAAKKY